MADVQPGSAAAWLLAIRPKTLPVGVAPIAVGGAVAFANDPSGAVNVVAVWIAALVAVLLQIASNLANDLFDYKKGTDGKDRLGPTRVTAAGLLSPRQVGTGTAVVLGLSLISGSYLVFVGGLPIALLGLLAVISALAYTGGPYPLGYNGLGDLFVFLFFGLAGVCGTAFLALGTVPPVAWPVATAIGLLATNVLVVNNVRDLEGDRRSGKRTLVVRFGRSQGVAQYVISLLVSFLVLPGIYWGYGVGLLVFLPALLLPLGVMNTLTLVRSREGGTLNALLAKTAMLTLLFALLLCVGLLFPF